ncbi:MAG: hypothetical protein JXR23_10295 [Pontiellaceae bacterium]|nr:hypothetical protein [Pontiellaceae bacterium]
MKVQPLKAYKPQPMPMQREFGMDSSFEKPSSNRWQQAARLAGSCAALQWMLSGAAVAEESATPVVPVASTPDNDHPENYEKPAEQVVPKVIPLLQEALANDGRGSHGCMAINPPAFLSEDDALDLIRKEFAKAGLKLDNQAPTVADIATPETSTSPSSGINTKSGEGNPINESLSLHPRKPFQFDLAFNNQTIRIEYIGTRDYETWQKPMSSMSSISVYELADTANRLRDSLVAQSDLEPGVYGIFFDPVAKPAIWPKRPNTNNMTNEEQNLAWREYQSASAKAAKAAGQAALQKQIDHFLAVLREEGLIETPAP